jgi:EPS-associated MarR family transcriptional regulator
LNPAGAISEDPRFQVLRLIDENLHASQREIANAGGVSLDGVNYCLRALARRGLLKIDNFRKSGTKFRYLYLLTPAGIAEKEYLTEAFIKRKMTKYEALRKEIQAVGFDTLTVPTDQPNQKFLRRDTSGD